MTDESGLGLGLRQVHPVLFSAADEPRPRHDQPLSCVFVQPAPQGRVRVSNPLRGRARVRVKVAVAVTVTVMVTVTVTVTVTVS